MMKGLIPTLALLILNLANGAPTKKDSGATAFIEWVEKGCEQWSNSFMFFWAPSQVEPNNEPSINFQYSHWHDCTTVSAIQTYVDSFDVEKITEVNIKKNLEGGSISSTFQKPIMIEKYHKNGKTPKLISKEETKVTVYATFVGTGQIYTGDFGRTRDATSSVTVTAENDTPLPVPSNVPGSIYYNVN